MHTYVTVGPGESWLTVAGIGVNEINARCTVLTWVTGTLIDVWSKKIHLRMCIFS